MEEHNNNDCRPRKKHQEMAIQLRPEQRVGAENSMFPVRELKLVSAKQAVQRAESDSLTST